MEYKKELYRIMDTISDILSLITGYAYPLMTDKQLHFILGAIISAAFLLVNRSFLKAFLFVLVLSVLKEAFDVFRPRGHTELMDVIASALFPCFLYLCSVIVKKTRFGNRQHAIAHRFTRRIYRKVG